MDNYKYMVCTYCNTYNQLRYIKDTLNGFLIQETAFPVVYAICDDCSTDGEADFLRGWANNNLICDEYKQSAHKVVSYGDYYWGHYKGNINANFVVLLLNANHYSQGRQHLKKEYFKEWVENSKYRALCEGDDYWITPTKLQKQVDFLENHNDYGLVHTSYFRLFQNTGEKEIVAPQKQYRDNCNDLKWGVLTNDLMIGTATTLCRLELHNKIRTDYADDYKGTLMGDVQTWFHMARLSKVYYFPEETAVYRKNDGSVTAMNSVKRYNFLKNAFEVHYRLANKYNAPDYIKNTILNRFGNSLINIGLDYNLYNELIIFMKEYYPRDTVLVLLLKMMKVIPRGSKGLVKRLLLYRIK